MSLANDCLSGDAHGEAGKVIVVEQFVRGEEASFMAIVGKDGQILPLVSSQDHKAIGEGDIGANTGGMGAYSPAPIIDEAMFGKVMAEVMSPTVNGLRSEGIDYIGFLYAGLIISDDGTSYVLEYNCRMGDPETQPILMRLESDLVDLLLAALAGNLDQVKPLWTSKPCLGVVMAEKGYPQDYKKGQVLDAFDEVNDSCKVFHAGTTRNEQGAIVTSGGRVLCVCAVGDTLEIAQKLAYEQVEKCEWSSCYYRKDIGYRALTRSRST